MTVGEITHGRGTPMSAHELAVIWPMYDVTMARIAEYRERQESARPRVGGRR